MWLFDLCKKTLNECFLYQTSYFSAPLSFSVHSVFNLFDLFSVIQSPLSHTLCRLGLLLGEVSVVVEVTEESDETERVGKHSHVHGVREVTVDKQVVGGVEGYDKKLELRGQTDT